MLGIDIYERYQDVTDWGAVARHGVRFCWVKASDGGVNFRTDPGRRPDSLVAGARSVGITVGLYHYAQFSPGPESQADVLMGEVRRLGATALPPALDLEDPFVQGPKARDFAVRFLRRLVELHGVRPAIYANTSMFSAIRPDTWNIPGLVIWAADYGANTGKRNPDLRPYTGRADVHQYTSNGTVPGIAGRVDLNETITDAISGGGQEDDMTPDESAALFEVRDALREVGKQTGIGAENGNLPHHTNYAATVADAASYAWQALNILQELKARPPADVDEAQLADELIASGLTGGASKQDVQEAIRAAFARAGEGGTA